MGVGARVTGADSREKGIRCPAQAGQREAEAGLTEGAAGLTRRHVWRLSRVA
jgi:hypothetical protein